MKKLSTTLSKCYSTIIAALIVMSHAISASAEEYKSMIRYDRVWECYCDGYGPGLTVKCMKFAGTEEINGKEYHKIETFRKTFPKYDPYTQTYTYDNYVDGLNEHEGYLREENGVAYTLIVCAKDDLSVHGENFDSAYATLFIPGKYEPKDNEALCEIQVYDFTKKQGEAYEGMSFRMELSHSCTFTEIRDENIEIGGEMYRQIYLYPGEVTENANYYGEEVVEGIGAIEHGCLNYHELIDRPTMIWAHNYFTRLLDLDGNVIYNPRPDPMFDIAYGSFSTPDGVDLVDTSAAAAPCHDILGRRIAQPAPGQLYIQGGRKHIAK